MSEEDEAAKLLAQLGLGPSGGGGGSKKSKKKKPAGDKAGGAAADEAEDAGEAKEAAEAAPEAAKAGEAGQENDEGGDDEGDEAGGASSSKNKKKKKKAAAAKVEEKKEPAPAAAPKLSKAAKMAKEAQERAQRAREEQQRLEEEMRRREEEERLAEEERKRKEEEEKELKRKKKEEKKARLLAEGKPVTKAEKEKARKLAEARAQYLAMGVIAAANKPDDGDDAAQKKDKDRKKNKEKKKRKENPLEGGWEEPKAEGEEEEEEITKKEEVPAEAAAPEPEKDWDEEDDLVETLKQLKTKVKSEDESAKEKVEITEKASSSKSSSSKSKSESRKEAKAAEKQSKEKKKSSKSKKKQQESSSDESDSDSDSYDEEELANLRERIQAARARRLARYKKAREEAEQKKEFRSPICCVLGHVDTGKTKILDMLRKTNVQEGEAGGITQQIGATFFPAKNMQIVTDRLPGDVREDFKIPGLLVIDTPGHEAFSNLRSRGSGLADVAILVIDIMHGLEPQTIESIELLKKRNTVFVVALNKVDRLYDWKVHPGAPIRETLEGQKPRTKQEFEDRTKSVITQLMQQGLNAKLYWENDSPEDTISLCPTSAITGEGSPDLINNIVHIAQSQKANRISFSNELECTVLEVKKIEGLGTTIDVCLVNGELHDNDTLVLASFSGPIVTQVRSLLTPQPMREMRIKGDYILHKTIKGAMGIKITCQAELENVVAGTSVFQLTAEDDVEELKDAVMKDVADNLTDIATVPRGVFVQCSTLGSLEGLMVHLRKENIPVAGVGVGPVRKKDVTRASAMLESKNVDPDLFEREYASILAFNVKVDNSAKDLAEEMGIKIFMDETIYNLTDQYIAYSKQMREERRKNAAGKAVFPAIVRIIPGNVFNNKNPLVIGVDVVRGCLVEGTPIVVPEKLVDDPQNPGQKMMLELGKVVGIEKDRVKVSKAVRGEKVCIKIQGSQHESHIQVGRQFDESNNLVSKISRKSIDVLKVFFKEDIDALKEEGWSFIQNELKKIFKIT